MRWIDRLRGVLAEQRVVDLNAGVELVVVGLRDPGHAERRPLDDLDAGLDALRKHGTAVPIVEQQDAARLQRSIGVGQHALEFSGLVW